MVSMSNSEKHVTIMGIPFVNVTKRKLVDNYLYNRLINKEKTFVVTANPEIVMLARSNDSFNTLIQKADYIVPDGAGVVLASRIIGNPLPERIPGYDLMIDLIKYAEQHQLRCYFLGAKKEVNDKMIDRLAKYYPKLQIAGKNHGFFDLEDVEIVDEIIKTKPDLIFVALGSPNQEKWITKYHHLFDKGLFMGVGGSFDVLAGEVKRAPDLWIRLNLEWLYRLIKQPFRWKRILKVFEFMLRIIFKKY